MPRLPQAAALPRPSCSADPLDDADPPPLADRVLLVEDNEDDVFLFRRLLSQAQVTAGVDITTDGETAVRWLAEKIAESQCGRPTLPRAIFLDLKLPGMLGLEVLRWLRAQPELDRTLVAICTSSSAQCDRADAEELGAPLYFQKYPSADRLAAVLGGPVASAR